MNRTQALCQAFGWQGGTIHQVAEETGCTVEGLLYGECHGEGYNAGWYAACNYNLDYCRRYYFPKHKGDLNFWIGFAEGLIHWTNAEK